MSIDGVQIRNVGSASDTLISRGPFSSKNEELLQTNQEHEQVERFCRQYQQRLDLKLLAWPLPRTLQNVRMQERIWTAIEVMQHDMPFPAYDRRILKELMTRIEDAVKDMDDPICYPQIAEKRHPKLTTLYLKQDILDSFAELSAELFVTPTSVSFSSLLPDSAPAEDAYIWARYTVPWLSPSIASGTSHSALPNSTIDILENPRVLAAAGCTGHRTWEAALSLASLLGYSPYLRSLLKDARVLELGAGTGLVGFAAAMLPDGPKSVRATDGDAGAVERLERTAKRWQDEATAEQRRCAVRCEVLLWGDLDETEEIRPETEEESIDVVLAADVTYDPVGIPDLVVTLRALLVRNLRTAVIIAATMRNADTLAVFEGECETKHLGIERLSNARLGVDTELESMGIGIGGNSKADATRQKGFFHAPAADIVIMQVTLLADAAIYQ